MSNKPRTSRERIVFEDDEIFEDSSLFANFNNLSFTDKTSKISENHLNQSANNSALNVSALCCDEELNGYDKLSGETWIYPTNYPVRDYQFNIIKASILKNTLVSLPTGLGKTFIAAVIMLNFYRWYPLGKIVFTAPTRPLVAQQIEACYNIVAIPPEDTVEMTGHMHVNTRKAHWQSKRVFFATPQVIYNDIKSGICPAHSIRCLVLDEAHRARGNYAFCQIIATLDDMACRTYRVLALSATPGSKVDDVITVIKNLHISHLELRTENCIDVAPYSHARRVATEVVPLGPELTRLRDQYIEILDVYARRLKQINILPNNVGNLSKGRVVMLYKEYQNRDRTARHPQHNYIMKDFTFLIALYHGLELLTKHGTRVFLNFFDEHPEKKWIHSDDRLTALLERLRDDLGVNPLSLDTSVLPDGTVPEIPKNISFGHPKFYKLKEIMLAHFQKAKQIKQDTRAIVFCEYRESVSLVHCLLLQCRPLIAPMMFVGQGSAGKEGKAAVSQKQQLRVMRQFREGACNALVATCVAEEGLDVGAVDLIVCFDISNASPVRLVQRCGRTGRERQGQVHILVTEGREHQTLLDCMRQRDGLNKKVLSSRLVKQSLFAHAPRLLPRDHTPQCQKMFLTVKKRQETVDKKKNQKDLRTMLLGKASSSSSSNASLGVDDVISQAEFNHLYPDGFRETDFFESAKEYWCMSKETLKATNSLQKPKLNLSTWLEWQRSLQLTVNVDHSIDSEILSSLLQYGDARRFDLPASTQNPAFNTQDLAAHKIFILSPAKSAINSIANKIASPAKASPVKPKPTKKKPKLPAVKGQNDGDIRAMFSTATSTKTYTKVINDLGIENSGAVPTKLLNLLVDLNLKSASEHVRTCYICENICNCIIFHKSKEVIKMTPVLNAFITAPKFPDLDLISEIDAESIRKCAKENESMACDVSYLDVEMKNCSNNFELEFDFDAPIDLTSPDNTFSKEDIKIEDKFDLGDIEDIFVDSSPGEAVISVKKEEKNSSDPKEALGFFGLDSIDDIFADSDESNCDKSPKNSSKELPCTNKPKSPKRNPVSPSILSGQMKCPTSPILCSQPVRKLSLSTKRNHPQSSTPSSAVKRQSIPETNNNIKTAQTPAPEKSGQTSIVDTANKSVFTITQLVDMINKTNDTSVNVSEVKDKERSMSPILLTQADKKKAKNNSFTSQSILSSQTKRESLIILESDSDSDDNTQVYDVDIVNETNTKDHNIIEINTERALKTPENKNELNLVGYSETFTPPPLSPNENHSKIDQDIIEINSERLPNTPERKNENNSNNGNSESFSQSVLSPVTNKRKLSSDDEVTASPYFNKKPKLDVVQKQLSLKEKVIRALKSDKFNKKPHRDSEVNIVFSPQQNTFQKENKDPFTHTNFTQETNEDNEEYVRKSNLSMLQVFKKDSKVNSPKTKFNLHLRTQSSQSKKRKLTFDDSDDDFLDDSCHRNKAKKTESQDDFKSKRTTNHKVRKKKPKASSFIELEAELSDDASNSGDELSDDSIGSIADFLCDDDVSHSNDVHALYLRSVKSPVKPGVFKIPQLPQKYNPAEVFSQYVENDESYEMDSFCVDSHIGLTQANDISELEVAEMLLEERRKKKRSQTNRERVHETSDNESPLVRKNRVVKRIHSDSDDSS